MTQERNRRILLIDDNPAIHADFVKLLQPSGAGDTSPSNARAGFFGAGAAKAPEAPPAYDIESAYQGQEALEKVRAAREAGRPYAMAFVDVRMPPGWDGVETIERLWQVDPDLQCVICTAYADYSWSDMIDKLGRNDRLLILKKPFDAIEACQLALALVEKWNSLARERDRLEEVRQAEQEAQAYAASLETMNRALELSRIRAEAAAKAKTEFLANMSHEIRTPMIEILGNAELILAEGSSASERRACAEGIRAQGEALMTVLCDILDLSELDTGRMEVERSACSPLAIAHEVVEHFRPRAEEKGLTLTLDCREPIPETIHSDAVRLRQILVNLVGNAIKFTEHGTVRVEPRLAKTFEGRDPELEIDVADTGIGIERTVLDRLFETFTQGDSSPSRRHPGAGLGLALSRQLAQLLGGDLEVESTLGAGSRFRLRVRTGDLAGVPFVSHPVAPIPRRASDEGGPASPVVDGRILLVEDTPATQRLYKKFLEDAGADVELAADGAEARDRVLEARDAGRPFDLVLMDMQLPGVDGYQATRELRAAGWEGRILAITAHATTGERQRCLDVGCDDYASKPMQRATLLEFCAQNLGRVRGGVTS